MPRKEYEFDVCIQAWPEFEAEMLKYKLKWRVLEWEGPAGGNPVVAISGAISRVLQWVAESYDPEGYTEIVSAKDLWEVDAR
jgi:hypothetical protein